MFNIQNKSNHIFIFLPNKRQSYLGSEVFWKFSSYAIFKLQIDKHLKTNY